MYSFTSVLEILAVLYLKIKQHIHLTIDMYTKNWAINKNVESLS